MFRFSSFLVASALLLHGQSATFRWIQQLGGSNGQSIAGVATDSQGNIFVAGTTTSLDFPVRNALQPHPGSAGLYRIDGTGSNFQSLYQSGVNGASALAIDPQNPATVYVATATDIRRSSDAGTTWTVLATFQVAAIGGLAVDPTNRNILYVATTGQGVLKSTDGGLTYTPMNQGLPQVNNRVGVRGIWIDPRHPAVLFTVSPNDRFYVLARSADGGATWNTVNNAPVPVTGNISFDPNVGNRVYAADGNEAAVSADDGLTWTSLGKVNDTWQPTIVLPDPHRSGVLYGGSPDALWVSSDSGATWTMAAAAPAALLSEDSSTGVIYAVLGGQLVMSTDMFATTVKLGPPGLTSGTAIAAGGGHIFVGVYLTTDAFVVKLDPQGNVLFATYFGGISNDAASGIAVDGAGAVYVTGSSTSPDFPLTPGAYSKTLPGFVFKLNADGSLAWSTRFPATPNGIAVDAAGHAYIAGITYTGIPTTPGAYQTTFNGTFCGIGCIISIPPTNGFLTEFDTAGASLVFSTTLGTQYESANAVALLPDGSVAVLGQGTLYHLDRTGSTLIASWRLNATLWAVTADSGGNILVAGTIQNNGLTGTSGVFQPYLYSGVALPGTISGAGAGDAFVVRLDGNLNVLTSTYLGGESQDMGYAIAAAPDGSVLLGGMTNSYAFPTRGPVQGAFSNATGFLSQLSPDFSALVFSTYAGDTRPFLIRSIAVAPDGGILFGGQTGTPLFFTNQSYAVDNSMQAFVVRVDPPRPALPRIDAVVNAASLLGVPISPGAVFTARGDGFGADAVLLLNGMPMPLLAQSSTALTFAVPGDFAGASATVEVQSGGAKADMLVAGAAYAPGIYSVDGTGRGQGYILNKDGTVNSQSNPASPGDPVTIYATGVGSITFNQGYAVTDNFVNVYIGGLYANGIAAVLAPVQGLPGNVYQISMYVPNPAVHLQPQVAVLLQINGVYSQPGLSLAVKQ